MLCECVLRCFSCLELVCVAGGLLFVAAELSRDFLFVDAFSLLFDLALALGEVGFLVGEGLLERFVLLAHPLGLFQLIAEL